MATPEEIAAYDNLHGQEIDWSLIESNLKLSYEERIQRCNDAWDAIEEMRNALKQSHEPLAKAD